jgi:hypothetical protein
LFEFSNVLIWNNDTDLESVPAGCWIREFVRYFEEFVFKVEIFKIFVSDKADVFVEMTNS